MNYFIFCSSLLNLNMKQKVTKHKQHKTIVLSLIYWPVKPIKQERNYILTPKTKQIIQQSGLTVDSLLPKQLRNWSQYLLNYDDEDMQLQQQRRLKMVEILTNMRKYTKSYSKQPQSREKTLSNRNLSKKRQLVKKAYLENNKKEKIIEKGRKKSNKKLSNHKIQRYSARSYSPSKNHKLTGTRQYKQAQNKLINHGTEINKREAKTYIQRKSSMLSFKTKKNKVKF